MKRVPYTVDFFQDIGRATNIASRLYQQFSTKSGFFIDYEMPEYIPPNGIRRDSREYALYLTYVIAIDFQTNAIKLWNNARRLYETRPHLFDPATILNLSADSIRGVVRSLGARYPSGGASGWKQISEILLNKYDGDPRNVTEQPLPLEEVRKKLQDFPYLRGKKLNTFYIRAMGENGLFKVSNFDELGVAVDIQVARLTLYTGALRIKGLFYGCIHNEPLRPLIEDVWNQAVRGLVFPAWYLDEPLWSVRSKLCSKKGCRSCPIASECQRNFHVTFRGANVHVSEEG